MKLVMLGWIFSMAATAGLLAGEERKVTFHDVRFRTYEIDPSKEKLELIWRDEKGKPYKNLRTAQKAFAAKGRPLKFITNGGIYETDGKPLGLHVEEGIELVPLNKKFVKDGQPGWGNFYLEPGGVFSLDQDGKATVEETRAYARKKSAVPPRIACQSGPILVHRGEIHRKFRKGSKNVRYRNGVGVRKDGSIVFAICADGEVVNLHSFAELFHDRLGCPSALFLDADVSKMEVNPKERPVSSAGTFAAMFVITESD
ncbi:MAG: hypothetical protein ACI8T1_004231 [Verrucomicrobiales bacterium]|jgi:uncharacterized protein YigE (DUF2233 family)